MMIGLKKKVIFSLIAVVFFIVILIFVISFFRKGKTSGDRKIITNPTGTQTKLGSPGVSVISEVGDILTEKSIILVISLSKSDGTYLSDPIFQGLVGDPITVLRNDLIPFGSDIKIRISRKVINSDSLSGIVYMNIENGTQKGISPTLTYAKDPKGEWKLVDYKNRKLHLIKMEGEQ